MTTKENFSKLNGTLMPCFKKWPDQIRANYKIQSDEGLFYLVLNQDQEFYADSIVWDKVEVIGDLDRENGRMIVTRLNGNKIAEGYFDLYDDFPLGKHELEKKIRELGKIEPEDDLMAS